MARYSIDINIQQKGKAGAYQQAGGTSMDALKEQVQKAKEIEMKREGAEKKTGGGQRQVVQLMQQMQTDVKTLIRVNNEILMQLKLGNRGGGGGGGEGGGKGGGLFSQLLGGRTNLAQALGGIAFVGAIFGALQWAMQRVVQVGQANIQTTLQQLQTEQIGGFHTGGQGIYTAAQMGEMTYARRMKAGTTQAGRAGQVVTQYGGLFGLGANEVGQLVGTLDLLTKQRIGNTINNAVSGDIVMARAIATASKAGITTEIPLLLNAMQATLEEAVKAGVTDADIAGDMAKEVAGMMKAAPTASVQAAIASVRNIQGLQNQVARGKLSTMEEWEMYRATQQVVEQELKNPKSALIQTAINQGVITQEQVAQFTQGGNMPVQAMDALIRFTSQRMPGQARQQLLQNILQQFGGEGNATERIQRAMWVMSGTMPGLMEGSPAQIFQAFQAAQQPQAMQQVETPLQDAVKQATQAMENMVQGGRAATMMTTQLQQEMIVLGEVGQKAGDAVNNFNKSMLESAKNLTDVVIPAINGLDTVLTSMAKGANKATKTLQRWTSN